MDDNNQFQGDMPMMGQNGQDQEESVIEHNGKKYNRIQIEGLGDEDEYLMDDQGHVYTLDFKYLTNIGENVVISE